MSDDCRIGVVVLWVKDRVWCLWVVARWGEGDIQRITNYAEGEDDYGEGIAAVQRVAAKELGDGLFAVLWSRVSAARGQVAVIIWYLSERQCCNPVSIDLLMP